MDWPLEMDWPIESCRSSRMLSYAMAVIDSQEKLGLEILQQKTTNLTRQQKWQDAQISRNYVL